MTTFLDHTPSFPSYLPHNNRNEPGIMKNLFGSLKGKMSSKASFRSEKKVSTNPFYRDSQPPAPEPQQAPNIHINDAPPAYTPNAPSSTNNLAPRESYVYTSPYAPPRQASPAPSVSSNLSHISNDNDRYAFLGVFDTVFVIDDSGSMAGSNWREARDVISKLSEVCAQRDKDGVDVYFLNSRTSSAAPAGKASGGYYNIRKASEVKRIFEEVRPRGMTPTGTRLNHIFKPYIATCKSAKDVENVKPVNIIVITDGQPSDDPESPIVMTAKKLDAMEAPLHQVGIQFFQVGRDPHASAALQELDDGLAEMGIRDMVDTKTWKNGHAGVLDADDILNVVLGGVVRRLDRKK